MATKGDGKVDMFRGISFDDWLKLFMQVGSDSLALLCPLADTGEQFCFLLNRRGQYDVADEILRHIMVLHAYQARERQDSIRLPIISEHHFLALRTV